MSEHAASAEVIADRYLTSPSRLRARPFGPVDALDTQAGRAAQVRIVFLPGEWEAGELTDTVARWCGIGEAGVVGVLDFGRHADRWFVVLPPTLGAPVERWRSMRQPTGLEAARMALAFGRLLEAVAGAGFDLGRAELCDFAVGPGPTPFLEQPLFTSPGAPTAIRRRAGGQRVLAALFEAASADHDPHPRLVEWREAAAAEAHASLRDCLDALEQAAVQARAEAPEGEPAGLAGLFDGPLPPPRAVRDGLRRAVGPLLLAIGVLTTLALLLGGTHGPGGPQPARRTASPTAPSSPAVSAAATSGRQSRPAAATRPRRNRHATAAHRPSGRPPAAPRPQPGAPTQATPASPPNQAIPASPPTQATRASRPVPAPMPPAAPPRRSPAAPATPAAGGVTLPAPGGTVLPAP